MKGQPSEGNGLVKFVSAVFARSGGGKADEYFTPRLAHADQQLYALAARIKGTYRRGAVSWSSFAARQSPAYAPGEPGAPIRSRGSRVRKTMHGLEIEVSVVAEPVAGGLAPPPSQRLVLVPAVAIKAAARGPRLPVESLGIGWSADEENATGAERLRLLRARDASPTAPAPSLPPAVASARDRLIERATRIICTAGGVLVIAHPLPRSADDPRDFGQGSFELDALLDLIDRSRAFANALGA